MYQDAGWGQFPYEVTCPACDQGEDADVDDCRENDDIGESAPDDGSRFAAVNAIYPADRAA